jgi:hypothetical protein
MDGMELKMDSVKLAEIEDIAERATTVEDLRWCVLRLCEFVRDMHVGSPEHY